MMKGRLSPRAWSACGSSACRSARRGRRRGHQRHPGKAADLCRDPLQVVHQVQGALGRLSGCSGWTCANPSIARRGLVDRGCTSWCRSPGGTSPYPPEKFHCGQARGSAGPRSAPTPRAAGRIGRQYALGSEVRREGHVDGRERRSPCARACPCGGCRARKNAIPGRRLGTLRYGCGLWSRRPWGTSLAAPVAASANGPGRACGLTSVVHTSQPILDLRVPGGDRQPGTMSSGTSLATRSAGPILGTRTGPRGRRPAEAGDDCPPRPGGRARYPPRGCLGEFVHRTECAVPCGPTAAGSTCSSSRASARGSCQMF